MQRRKAELERKLENLARFFEDGNDSLTIRPTITKHEAEIADITAKTLGRKKGSVRRQIGDLRKFVKESVADIRGLLASKYGNPARVRQELARHIDGITLLPNGKREIRYKGKWKLLGATGSAEGRNRTQGLLVNFQIKIAA